MSHLLFYLAISKLKAQSQNPGRHELTAQLAEKARLLAVGDDFRFPPVSIDGALNGSALDTRHRNFILYIHSLRLILGGSAHIVFSSEPVGCSSIPTWRTPVGAAKPCQFSQCLSPHGARSVPTSLITHPTRQRLHSSPSAGWAYLLTFSTRDVQAQLCLLLYLTQMPDIFTAKAGNAYQERRKAWTVCLSLLLFFFKRYNWKAVNNETKPQKYPCELWLLLPAGSHFLIWSVLLLIQW